ncbi:Transposable element Tcb2 transposase, partial [Stegodyphus mimosarum]
MPTHRRLRWSGVEHEETGLQRNGTRSSLETNPDSISAVMTIVFVWKARGERLNPAFAVQRHIAPTAGVMVWVAIAYNTRSPLVLFRGTLTAQRYVHEILQPHVLPLMQRLPGVVYQQDSAPPHTARVSQDCLRTVTTLPGPARSPNMSPIEHIRDHLGRLRSFAFFSEINYPFSLIFLSFTYIKVVITYAKFRSILMTPSCFQMHRSLGHKVCFRKKRNSSK